MIGSPRTALTRIAAAMAGGTALAALAATGAAAQSSPTAAAASTDAGAFVLISGPHAALLMCGAEVGTHPDPDRACAAIGAADGDLAALPGVSDAACTLEYRPVSAHGVGLWLGAAGPVPSAVSTEYGNPCMANAQSSGVFGF